ncbi:hypothetical protein AcW1_004194 [Taiwanofungus camphoratus]|nr:hypothetical protein AcV5_000575 [Antrodia cinnamomea]KAI0951973.1 hypothetical protein AcV7_007916 [Antrodia cinnamomea]KAI0959345.1 hypothetical protein AcW1_004194 [Antrodia cinnamomea]
MNQVLDLVASTEGVWVKRELTVANIFFLDQPIGVGFSYADYDETIENMEDAAKDVHAFISIFFATFSQFAGRLLHFIWLILQRPIFACIRQLYI